MRTYALGSKVVIAVASALGLLIVMQRPWYGPAPADVAADGLHGPTPIDRFASGLQRWFGEPVGASAWQSFATTDVALAALAATAGAAALACLHPACEQAARTLLQLSALATCALVALKFVDQPGANAVLEPRYGIFVALGLALVLLTTASGINARPLRRRRPAAMAPHQQSWREGP